MELISAENKNNSRGNPAWKKGIPSPNPAGRPKASYDFAAMCRERTQEALDNVLAIGRDPNQPGNVRLDAWRTILVYGHGKPIQQIQANVDIRPQIITVPAPLTPDQLEALYRPQMIDLKPERGNEHG